MTRTKTPRRKPAATPAPESIRFHLAELPDRDRKPFAALLGAVEFAFYAHVHEHPGATIAQSERAVRREIEDDCRKARETLPAGDAERLDRLADLACTRFFDTLRRRPDRASSLAG